MQIHRPASPVRFHDKRPLSLKLLQYLFIGHYFFPSAFPLCGSAEIISPCTLASSEPRPVHPRQAVAPPLSGHHEETGHLLIIRTSPQKSFIPLICYGSPSVIWSRPLLQTRFNMSVPKNLTCTSGTIRTRYGLRYKSKVHTQIISKEKQKTQGYRIRWHSRQISYPWVFLSVQLPVKPDISVILHKYSFPASNC